MTFVNGVPVRFDGGHLTMPTMKALSGFVLEAIAKAAGAKLNSSAADAKPSPEATDQLGPDTVSSDWANKIQEAAKQKRATSAEVAEAAQGRALSPPHKDACYFVNDASTAKACTQKGSGSPWTKAEGPQPRKVVLIGDSMASQWLGSLAAALPPGSKLIPLAEAGCHAWGKATGAERREGRASECDRHRKFSVSELARIKPDMIVTSILYGHKSTDVRQFIGKLAAQTKVLWIGFPPDTPKFDHCLGDPPVLAKCNGSTITRAKPLSTYMSIAGSNAATFLNLSPMLCTAAICPAFIDGHAVRWDGSHLTNWTIQKLQPLLRAALSRSARSSN